jgi:outer membrane receptor for ferrienterochelin and colicin
VHNNRNGNDHNVSFAVTDPFSLTFAAIANQGISLDPSVFTYGPSNTPYPLVGSNFGESYDFAATALAGLVTVVNKTYNQDKTGQQFAPGVLIPRHFKSYEAEWYAQDSWRVTPNLVLTGGLRYSLLQPPTKPTATRPPPTSASDSCLASEPWPWSTGKP